MDGEYRLIAHQKDVPDLPIKSVMTSVPIIVRESDLAVDVLKIYEEHNIDDLLVVDDQGRLVGMIDIQDLPRFKIL